MPELILAHDLGTTGDKASLFSYDGELVASTFSGYRTDYPRAGWAEQDGLAWWDTVQSATRALLSAEGISSSDVSVVAFSGQMMGCLAIDAQGEALAPAIIWADTRAQAEASLLRERIGGDHVYQVTGHRASASYSAAKLLWLRAHRPEVFAATDKMLQAKDFVAFCLTNEYATDYSDASGTNLFDLRARKWSSEILDALQLDPGILPPAVPSATIVGEVTRRAASLTGLVAGTPVVIGGGDGACATAGAGVVAPGDAYAYIGASSWISFVDTEPLYDPRQRTFTFVHLDPDRVFPTGTMQCAGGSLDWLERLFRGDGRALL